MVEVYKTDVKNRHQADFLIREIQKKFDSCEINFDLDDCDKVLRIESREADIPSSSIISLLDGYGFRARILSDEPQPKNL